MNNRSHRSAARPGAGICRRRAFAEIPPKSSVSLRTQNEFLEPRSRCVRCYRDCTGSPTRDFFKPRVPFLPTGWSGAPCLTAGRGGGSLGPWLPAVPRPPGPPAPGPHGPAAAAARVRSEHGRSLQPACRSLCASEPPAPNFTFCTGRPRGPPAPGLSPLPSLLFLCFSSRHFSLGLLLTLLRQSKGRTWKANLKADLFSPPPPQQP